MGEAKRTKGGLNRKSGQVPLYRSSRRMRKTLPSVTAASVTHVVKKCVEDVNCEQKETRTEQEEEAGPGPSSTAETRQLSK